MQPAVTLALLFGRARRRTGKPAALQSCRSVRGERSSERQGDVTGAGEQTEYDERPSPAPPIRAEGGDDGAHGARGNPCPDDQTDRPRRQPAAGETNGDEDADETDRRGADAASGTNQHRIASHYLRAFASSRRHAKYASIAVICGMFGAGRALAFASKCITVCDDSVNAGHFGRPGPLGSPVLAKLTQ